MAEWKSDEGGADEQAGGPGVLARLLIALVLCIVLAVGCWVVAPRLGVALPPIAPLVGFAVIAGGTLLGMWEGRARGGEGDGAEGGGVEGGGEH